MTKVVFRVYDNGEVVALFPQVQADPNGNCTSYVHNGQHGAATYSHVIKTTKPATEEQYTPLLEELKSLGYNDLQIHKRFRPFRRLPKQGSVLVTETENTASA